MSDVESASQGPLEPPRRPEPQPLDHRLCAGESLLEREAGASLRLTDDARQPADGDLQRLRSVEVRTREIIQKYQAAMREMEVRFEILDQDLNLKKHRNPIHHVESRIKKPASIFEKLGRYGKQPTLENMERYIMDIAGVRVICSYIHDVYNLLELLQRQDDLEIVTVKDYIANPKPNGYKSYHLVTGVPIYRVDGMEYYPVEIQFRTMAMDLWASLEHRSCYKRREEDKQAWSDWFLKYSRILEQMEQEVAEYGRGQAVQPPSAASPGTATAGTSDPGHS